MCKGTWVCFKCRTTARRDTWRFVTRKNPSLIGDIGAGRVRCPHCRSACQFLGPSIAIPPKRELTSWRRLQAEVTQFRQDVAADRRKSATRKKHDLERRIRDLKSRPVSSERTRLVKELEKELSDA
jgi:hypothetical protein